MSEYPQVVPLGDSALLVVLGEGVRIGLSARVARLAAELRALPLRGVNSVVPAYAAVAIYFDPIVADGEALTERLETLARLELARPEPEPSGAGTVHTIPVHYDGPDIEAVAERLGLRVSEVVQLHSGRTYRVFFLGFVPGFGYLGPLDPALALPRREVPRRRVAPGSVGIAGEQTGIYPVDTPGGWHLIGRTDVRVFDPRREPPSLLVAGDQVRFEPVR